ncbi:MULTISPECIES: hypothetical protein [unclassified Mycobacterium]|uniref:hypothetical protein n=1 Tax=unclassified Mycobacterium TaxID=2642494 RepID=UPI0012E7A654|nr:MULTISPECIES: hypothetical protein [unclassified Mycobacterium]
MCDSARNPRETGCGHPACKSDEIERQARDAAAAVLGDEDFIRVCEQETPGVKPDFRSSRHALEVKELTSPALQKFFAAHVAHREYPHRPIEGLTQTWLVFADVSDAIESSMARPGPRVQIHFSNR